MLFPVVRMAKDMDVDEKQALFDIATDARIARLVRGDTEHEFLLACLIFYVTVKWNYAETFADAWAVWDPYEGQSETLVDIIRKRLKNDEIVSSLILNKKKAKEELNQLIAEIESDLEPHGYRGVRLAELIHTWYVKQYIRPWLEKIRDGKLLSEESKKYKESIFGVIKEKDLVDACPYQNDPPDNNMSPIEGKLKIQLNGRIEKLLHQARTILQLNGSLQQKSGQNGVDAEKLITEINLIVQGSEIKSWSIMNLLGAHLPILVELSSKAKVTK